LLVGFGEARPHSVCLSTRRSVCPSVCLSRSISSHDARSPLQRALTHRRQFYFRPTNHVTKLHNSLQPLIGGSSSLESVLVAAPSRKRATNRTTHVCWLR